MGAYDPDTNLQMIEDFSNKTNPIRFYVKELDFRHLECLILSLNITDHLVLVNTVNRDWAKPLGFSMKLKRSPKINKDDTKTLRMYCRNHNRLFT